MQSAAKKPFLLKYQGKSITRRLALSDKISQIILMARPLFNLSNEDNLHLRINGQDQESDKTLEELGLKGAEEIEVILMTSTPQDLSNICFCIKGEKDSDFHDWAVSLSKKLIEAKREFCASQDIDSALYNLSIDGTSIDENLILSEIPDLEDIVFTLEKKQEKPIEEEVDIRDIRLLVSGSEVYELPLNWLAKVKLLKALVTQDLEFPQNVTQQWSIEGKELKNEDSLKSQMKSENSTIDIDRLTPFLCNIASESQTVNKTILMDSCRTVGFLKQNKEIASIINSKSQFWFINDSKEPLQDDRHLLDYTEDQIDLVIYVKEQTESSPRTKSQIKKIYSFKYKNSVLKKQFSLDEDVEVVTQSIVKSLNISGSTRLSLNFKDNMLEPTKSLSDYMKGPEGVISIVPVEDETNCVKLTFLFNDDQKEVSAKYTQTIKELRDEACSTFAIDNSYYYSIFLDLQRLELSQLVREVENLGEESVLELQAAIEIKIASQNAKTTLIFSPNKTVDDLKIHIQAKKLINSTEFDLCLGQRPLEGTHMLGHYIQNDDEVIITIVEKMHSNNICQINLKLCDIEANLTKFYSLKEDSQTLVSTLKKLAGPELSVKPARQCWMIDNTELLDHLALKDYLERHTDSVNIDVYILHDFLLLTSQQESPISMSLALNTRISDIKEKIKAKYEHIELEKTKLQAYQHVLEEDKSLKDYMNLWNDHNRPTISVLKAVNLTITFNAKPEIMCFSAQAGAVKVKELIKQKFALQDHDIELWEGERRVDDKELETILQNQIEKVLTCKKMKSVIITYADQETFEEKLCLDSQTTLSYFKSKAKEKLKISEESCEVLFNSIAQKEDTKTLDEIDPSLSLLRFTVQSVKELEVVNNDQRYNIHYAPLESVEDIKGRLKEKGFTDVDKFSLWFNQQILTEGQPLRSYGMSYGKHILTAKLKKIIFVVLPFEQKEYTYGEDTTTVGDLKKKIEKLDGVPANKQILILLKDKEWHRRLIDTNEKIADIEEENITILCRTSKKFAIIFGINGKLDVFEGIYGAVIQEQKKLFEIVYNVPIANQIWSIGLGTSISAKFMEDTLSIESYGIQGFDEANPIRVYRKINLTVCLSQKSETLEDLPTYETIGAQKLKISKKLAILPEDQLWSYNEKELEDEKMLEDYFTTSNKEDSSRDVNAYAVDLVVQNDLEYFGFTEKNEINVDLFTSFFIESDEELDKIIQSVSFNKKESSLQFRNKLLGLFFGVLKKHSMWENLISKIKKRTFDIKGVNLWKSNEKNKTVQSKFNTQFLLYYFLNSGTPELNVEMLSIMKMHFPVPLAINSWTNRFSVEGMKVLDVLYWIMQKSFVVTSFGIGGAESRVCGKSELNNQILFSNFVKDSERNQICKGCPEILFDIYKNDKFPVNLVDIPSDTNEEIRNRIIANSNMLIIHSLADQNQTLEYLKRLPNKVPTIILYRDIHRAFSHIGVFRENLTNSLKAAFTTGVLEIKIADLRDDDRSNELNEISSKVQEYILTTFQATNDSDLWRFFNFLEGYDEHFNTILDKIRSNSSQLVQAIPIFNDLKKLERNETISEKARQDELTRLNQNLDKNLLAPEINELIRLLVMFEFLPSIICSESPKLFLEKLQDYLRMMKSQQTKDFFKLYEFKSTLSEASSGTIPKTIEQFCQYWNSIKKQNYHYQNMDLNKNCTKQEADNLIERSIDIFEQKIIPNIFSIELFWRELIYFTSLRKNYKVNLSLHSSTRNRDYEESVQLYDFLVKLKRENILSGFPFEVIDGDLLYMPKEFFKNVFKGYNDRVVIISVLGPQSSGKSTLLNFLFGCNFVTSSGRCTKGIYGTYFKVSNFNSCDGILVLDTEGLFGLLNKNEEQHRDKFDRKLVLFCLAMSDFVLINFKGDIDKTLTEVLMVCRDSLAKLQQGNIQIPEMFLILNQNAQTNINTQLQDINKMSELGFSLTNVDILPLAFETRVTESTAITKFMDPVLKKIPKKEFSEKCANLAQKIFDKINSNVDSKKQRTLETAMDRMDHLWELLNKFPDLIKHTTMKDQAQEKAIKDWIENEVDNKLRAKVSQNIEDFKNSPGVTSNWEQKFLDKFNEEEVKVTREFYDIFQEKTNPGLFNEMETTLLSHIRRARTHLMNDLSYYVHQKKIKIYDIQGVEAIREAAYMIKSQPNMKREEKNKYFEKVWAEIVENLASSYNRNKESDNLFQIVKENYKTNLITLKGVLPTTHFPLDFEFSVNDYRGKLLDLVTKDYYIVEKAFEYTKQAPALIFKGGKSNIEFKYFNLKKYFDYIEAEELIGLSKSKVYDLFDVNKLREEIAVSSTDQEEEVITKLIIQIQKELDTYGVFISFHLLQKTLDFKRQNSLTSRTYTQPVQYNEIDQNSCSYTEEKPDIQQNIQLIFPESLKSKYAEWKIDNRATFKTFFEYVLSECINWNEITRILEKELWQVYQNAEISDIIAELCQDLQKINLQFINTDKIQENLLSLCFKEAEECKLEITQEIEEFEESLSDLKCEQHRDISKQNFSYLKQDILQENLQRVSAENTSQHFVVAKWKGKKLTVKKNFQNIAWLDAYANDEFDKIFVNTTRNNALFDFVFNQFSFKALLQDIFDSCIETLEGFDSWTYNTLYQTIARETNDLIGTANNDLQQVAYRLDFKLVGHIHLAVVYLVWKYFELKHWTKITEPLVAMQSKKDQQKKYFDALASADHNQINASEGEKARQSIENYVATYIVLKTKKELIAFTSKKFQSNMSRKQVQDIIDAKCFSHNSTVGNDELYHYMVEPRKTLLKFYEETSKNYIQTMQTEIQQKNVELNTLLQALLQRINSIQQILASFGEDFWAVDNVFEFKEYKAEKNDVIFTKYDSSLGAIYYRVVIALLEGDTKIFSREHPIDFSTKVIMKRNDSLRIPPLLNLELVGIIDFLAEQSGRVTNASLFIKALYEQVNQLISKTNRWYDLKKEDIKEFQDKINIFICKQKCPCCDRICDIEDPNHNTHQCRFGHQIRALGGVMMQSKEASVSRCEDIEDIDEMMYNGQEITWMEFKQRMKTLANNPWNFDDLVTNRHDTALKDKFKLAWTLVGKRICEEKYKSSGMRFVPYNKNTVNNQKGAPAVPKNYIFVIDSSSSMKKDSKWKNLLESLRRTLQRLHSIHKDNKVTIINFSSAVKVEYTNESPNSVNVNALTFQNDGTSFGTALRSALEHIETITKNDIVLIFMTDGEDMYPEGAVKSIKEYLSKHSFRNLKINFDFNAIGFKCKSPILNVLASDLGGSIQFADTGIQLTNAFMEVLNKKESDLKSFFSSFFTS